MLHVLIAHHLLLLLAVFVFGFVGSIFAASIDAKPFGTTTRGEAVKEYILTNANGASANVLTMGGIVTRIVVPDTHGKLGDVALGFDDLKQYESESPYFGAAVGRVANRIKHGVFHVENVRYCVPVNNGPNALHGGLRGYDKRIWQHDAAMTSDGPSLRLTLLDPDAAEGYPGNVKVEIIYSLTKANGLKIQYIATTDKATPINLTNHSYFNLKDAGKTNVFTHQLKTYADAYTPVDETLIPTGEIAPVKGTPIDFTSPKPIGQDLKAMGGNPAGYDHNLVLRGQDGQLAKAAEVYEPESGRFMEVFTTEPGMQLYTGNFLDGSIKGRAGITYGRHSAFCLECAHYPDSINQPNFPSTLLSPGAIYRQITEYRFSVPLKKPW